jgi:Asp-tRNA(Asn)/Glu-tRNA(Gln) amidotransferase A subunit family amidase
MMQWLPMTSNFSDQVLRVASVAPITRSQNGLPIRLQIVARSHGDRTTIAVAALIELLSGGFAPH